VVGACVVVVGACVVVVVANVVVVVAVDAVEAVVVAEIQNTFSHNLFINKVDSLKCNFKVLFRERIRRIMYVLYLCNLRQLRCSCRPMLRDRKLLLKPGISA